MTNPLRWPRLFGGKTCVSASFGLVCDLEIQDSRLLTLSFRHNKIFTSGLQNVANVTKPIMMINRIAYYYKHIIEISEAESIGVPFGPNP